MNFKRIRVMWRGALERGARLQPSSAERLQSVCVFSMRRFQGSARDFLVEH